MNSLLEMITIAVMAVLYGLAWHNQPSRDPADHRRPEPKREGQS